MYDYDQVEKYLIYLRDFLDSIIFYNVLYKNNFEYHKFDDLYDELKSLKNNYKENTFITDTFIMKLEKIGTEIDEKLSLMSDERGHSWVEEFMKDKKVRNRASRKLKLHRVKNYK